MISGDSNIFDESAEVRARMMDYASLFDELHIVVIGKKIPGARMPISIGNLFLYPAGGNLIFRFFRAYQIVSLLYRKTQFSVISAQGPDELGMLGFYAARRFSISFQLQIHTDILSPWYRRASWHERIRYLIAIYLIPRADCIRVVSERIRHSLHSTFHIPHSRIAVLSIFTDISKFLTAPKDPATETRFSDMAPRLISSGRFVDKEKNFSMLIEVMKDVIRVFPKALLLLAGDGPDKQKYQRLIARDDLEKNVIIEPWRSDLPSFYPSFDLFVLPSNYEGWGRVVIEALGAGLPVIMTDVGLAGEVVINENNGIIVPVGDKKALLRSILSFFQDERKRDRLLDGVRQSQKKFLKETKKEFLEKYRKGYECCIGRNDAL